MTMTEEKEEKDLSETRPAPTTSRARRPSQMEVQREVAISWSFDVFEAGEGPLVATCARVLGAYFVERVPALALVGVVEDVRENMTRAWVDEVPRYHNFFHGADVLLVTCHFMLRCGARAMLTEVEALGLAVAALGHDVCHPGLNNAYHVAAGLELAIRYSDVAVLEAHSAAVMSKIVRDRKLVDDIFSPTEFRRFRAVVVQSILATDMAGHFKLMDRLKSFSTREGLDKSTLLEQPEDRMFVCDVVLHCADLSNPARPWDVSKQWSDRVCDEFFKQGDRERAENQPVSPNMDRNTTPPWKLALGFADFIVRPLFKAVSPVLNVEHALNALDDNRRRWGLLKDSQSSDDNEVPTQQRRQSQQPQQQQRTSLTTTTTLKTSTTGNTPSSSSLRRGDSTARIRRTRLIDAVHLVGDDLDLRESVEREKKAQHTKSLRRSRSRAEADEEVVEEEFRTLVRMVSWVAQDLEKTTKPARIKVMKWLQRIWRSQFWSALVIGLVVLSLLLDSFRRAALPKSADPAVNGILVGMLSVFAIEIVIGCLVQPKYVGSFAFWANVIGTVALAVDVPYLLGRFLDRGASASVRAARVARLARFVRLGRASFLVHFVDRFWPPKRLVGDSVDADGWVQSDTLVKQNTGIVHVPHHRASVVAERRLKHRHGIDDQSVDGPEVTTTADAAASFSSSSSPKQKKTASSSSLVATGPAAKGVPEKKTGGVPKKPTVPEYSETLQDRAGKTLSIATARVMLMAVIAALCAMPFADPASFPSRFDAQRQLLRALGDLSHAERLSYVDQYDPGRDRYGMHALYLRIGGYPYVPRHKGAIRRRRRQEKHDVHASYSGPRAPNATVSAVDSLLVTDARRYERNLATRELLIMIMIMIVVNVAAAGLTMIGDRVVVRPIREMVDLVERVERLLLILQVDVQQSAFETDFIETSIAKISQLLAVGFATHHQRPASLKSDGGVESTRVQAAFVFVNTHDLAVTPLEDLASEPTFLYLQLVHHLVRANVDFFGGKENRKTSGGAFLLVFADDVDTTAPDDDQPAADGVHSNSARDDDDDDEADASAAPGASSSSSSSRRRRRKKKAKEMLYSALRIKAKDRKSSQQEEDDKAFDDLASARPDWKGLHVDQSLALDSCCDAALQSVLACVLDANHLNATASNGDDLARQLRALGVDDDDPGHNNDAPERGLGRAASVASEDTRHPSASKSTIFKQRQVGSQPTTTTGGTRTAAMVVMAANKFRYLRHASAPTLSAHDGDVETGGSTAASTTQQLSPRRTSEDMAETLTRNGAALVFTAGLHFGWAVRNSSSSQQQSHESYMSPHVNLAAKLEVAASKVYGVPILFSSAFGQRLHQDTRAACRRVDRAVLADTGDSPVALHVYDFLPPVMAGDSSAFDAAWARLKSHLDHSELASLFDLNSPEDCLAYVATFDRAVAAYLEGRWSDAQILMEKCVDTLPADRPARTILSYMARSQFVCPSDWRGYRKI